MDIPISFLKELKEREERKYIDDSLFHRKALPNTPVPNLEHSLRVIDELKEAISVLQHHESNKNIDKVNS